MHRTRMPFHDFTISNFDFESHAKNTEYRETRIGLGTQKTHAICIAIEFHTIFERIAFFVEWILCLRIGNNKNKFISCTNRMKNNIWFVHKYLINEYDGCGLVDYGLRSIQISQLS